MGIRSLFRPVRTCIDRMKLSHAAPRVTTRLLTEYAYRFSSRLLATKMRASSEGERESMFRERKKTVIECVPG